MDTDKKLELAKDLQLFANEQGTGDGVVIGDEPEEPQALLDFQSKRTIPTNAAMHKMYIRSAKGKDGAPETKWFVKLNETGLIYSGETDTEITTGTRIADPIYLINVFEGAENNDSCGLEIAYFPDKTTVPSTMVIQTKDFSDFRNRVLPELFNRNFYIKTGEESALQEWLQPSNWITVPRTKVRSAPGWDKDFKFFVLPDGEPAIGNPNVQYLTTDAQAKIIQGYKSKGTLDGWFKSVLQPAIDGDATIFVYAMLLSLSSPLLPLLQAPPIIVNYSGKSSVGKTTALRYGASVWGSGGAPNASTNSPLLTGNTTINAIESLLAERNHTFAGIDELTMAHKSFIETLAYKLAGGRGKERMTPSMKQKHVFEWLLCVLLSSEAPYRQLYEESGKSLQMGQDIRIFDITVDDTDKPFAGKPDAKEKIAALENGLNSHYGHLGRVFVEYLISQMSDEIKTNAFIEKLRQTVKAYSATLTQDKQSLDMAHYRVANQQAIIMLTAELLIESNKLTLTDEHKAVLLAAPEKIFKSWLNNHQILSTEERGLDLLRDFYLKNQKGFIDRDCDPEKMPPVIYGYELKDTMIYFSPDAIKEALRTTNKEVVLNYAENKEMLEPGTVKERKHLTWLRINKKLVRVYAFNVQKFLAEAS